MRAEITIHSCRSTQQKTNLDKYEVTTSVLPLTTQPTASINYHLVNLHLLSNAKCTLFTHNLQDKIHCMLTHCSTSTQFNHANNIPATHAFVHAKKDPLPLDN